VRQHQANNKEIMHVDILSNSTLSTILKVKFRTPVLLHYFQFACFFAWLYCLMIQKLIIVYIFLVP